MFVATALGALITGILLHLGFAGEPSDQPNKEASDRSTPYLQSGTVQIEAGMDRPGMRVLDSTLLPALLKKRDYKAPPTLKMLVIEIREVSGGFIYYPMDYLGTSDDRDDWWPASTVKLYAAIAALERIRAMGFTPQAKLTFEYKGKPETRQLSDLLERALVYSKNQPFDQLVEFVGCDWLNDRFLSKRNGLHQTVMLRSYFRRYAYPDGRGSNRISPKIIVEEGGRSKTIQARDITTEYNCLENGNCTTLNNLAEAMRRVMMHEHLPQKERFSLVKEDLRLLRAYLKRDVKTGGIWQGIKNAYKKQDKDRPIQIFHKPGYAGGWFSDNLFIRVKNPDERWIVTMANRPGRDACDEAAAHIGELMASGALTQARMEKN
ncbi:MAG: serine hydrolase [Myxococcota bacterium]|nr:serine hydrolase [Myxococcota bacterium]